MARPIRWDNIQVPDAGGAIGAFDAGADRISQSIEQLRSMAQEQTQINQTNYENRRERNTADIIDQLNRATTQDALSGVDFDQFGNQVRRSDLNQAFTDNTNRIRTEERQQRIDELNQAEFDLSNARFDQKKKEYEESRKTWGSPIPMVKPDGSTEYIQINAMGQQRVVDGYGMAKPEKVGKNSTEANSRWLANLGAELRKNGDISDPVEVRNILTKQADENGVYVSPAQIDAQVKLFENTTGLLESEKNYLDSLLQSGERAKLEFTSQLRRKDMEFEDKTHFPADIATYSQGDLVDVLKLDGKGDEGTQTYGMLFNGDSSPRDLVSIIVDKMGTSKLTEKQLNWLVLSSLRPGDNTIDAKALSQLSENYGNLLRDDKRMELFEKYNRVRNNLEQDVADSVQRHHTNAATQFKSNRLKGKPSSIPAGVDFTLPDLTELTNSIPTDKKDEPGVKVGVNPFRPTVPKEGFAPGTYIYPAFQ